MSISFCGSKVPQRAHERRQGFPDRVRDHVSLAHLLSASASWWAIRGVIPIHSTFVPNARMTLPPLAVTAYQSSPSSSGVRALWVNVPVSPSGVHWAGVYAFIAWIVSAVFACFIASLNHRSPWCSSPCIMVSVRAIRGVGFRRQRCLGAHSAIDGLHLCETAIHEQLRPVTCGSSHARCAYAAADSVSG